MYKPIRNKCEWIRNPRHNNSVKELNNVKKSKGIINAYN